MEEQVAAGITLKVQLSYQRTCLADQEVPEYRHDWSKLQFRTAP